ncbi:MAG: IS630 family transposase [Planctomycetota bacterium]
MSVLGAVEPVSKKKTLKAAEQDRDDVAQARSFWIKTQPVLGVDSLVFLDESGAQTNMTTRYGRAEVGQRCFDSSPHGHWKTLTMLSAIRSTGVIQDATVVVDGAMDSAVFMAYAEQCLAPSLSRGDIVVMDNLASHKAKDALAAIESVGASVWFLPAYSPDLNPIEQVWSKVKACLRRIAATTVEDLVKATANALRTITAQDCVGSFRACGYCH